MSRFQNRINNKVRITMTQTAFEKLMDNIRIGKGTDLEKAVVYHPQARRVLYDQDKAAEELARLRSIAEAAEMMAECLRQNKLISKIRGLAPADIFGVIDATALAAYEKAVGSKE
jgi:hypothetical protein